VILHQMADHQPAIRAIRESTKLLGLGEGQRKRLFDKDVFARLDSTTREFGMHRGRCRDCHPALLVSRNTASNSATGAR